MLDLAPTRTLEIGMAFGGSTLAIAASHRERGNTAPNVHTAIDLAQTSYWDNVANIHIEKAGLGELVRTIEEPSATALAHLIGEGERFDLVYVDGSHQFEDVFVDFYFASRVLNVGGVVLFDDSTDSHVAKVLRFIGSNCTDTFESFPLERYLKGGRREQFRRKIGELLGRLQMKAFRKTKHGGASLAFVDF
jgi:cephalosporin hydroxylase